MRGCLNPAEVRVTDSDRLQRSQRLRRRWRGVAEIAVAGMLAWAVLRTWFVLGFLDALVTASDSMAPSLAGPHYQIECRKCGRSARFAAQPRPLVDRALCPACGAVNPFDVAAVLSGDHVMVERLVPGCQPVRRWQAIAFRHPEQSGRLCVKRVVGMPGEQIELHDGDLYAGGQPVRKSLPEQHALAVLVNEFSAVGQPLKLPAGWIGLVNEVRLQLGFAAAVFDDLPYNAGLPLRNDRRHVVADLLLAVRVEDLERPESLSLGVTTTDGVFRLSFDAQGHAQLSGNATPSSRGAVTLPRHASALVELSTFDRQVLAAIDGRVVGQVALRRPATGQSPGVQIDFSGPGRLTAVRLYRDLYYARPGFRPIGRNLENPIQLGADEYYVLGDNAAISDDSRCWARPGVPESLIVGRAWLRVPRTLVRLGAYRFELPAWGQIGYIR